MKPFDVNGDFQLGPDSGGELRQAAIRGSTVIVASQGVSLATQIISTVVLARLLTASDFGLVTMVTTFSLLFLNFGLNGFTDAILQRERMDHFLASNLFWINVGAGVLLTIVFAGAGSLLAKFYAEPLVTRIAAGVSLSILFNSLSVVHLALLKRGMHFPTVAANDIIARVVSIGVMIVLAYFGWGYWALVAGTVVLPLSTSIGAWVGCHWIPAFPRRGVGTRAVARFVVTAYSRFGLGYFAGNADNLLVGWRFGAVSLGFYKKAFDLFALPAYQTVAPMTSVAVATLSRWHRDKFQYQKYLISGLSVLAFLGMALGADLTLVGSDLVRVVLGPRWAEAGRIFTFFGPGIGIMLIYNTHGWIHLSIGKPDRWLRWGLIEVSVTVLLFLVALHWGPVGIAMAWTTTFWILTGPALWYAGQPIQLGIAPILAALWKYVLASLVAGGICGAMIVKLHPLAAVPGAAGALERIAAISAVFLALYSVAVIVLHGGCEPFRQVARLSGEVLSQRFSKSKPQPEAEVDSSITPESPALLAEQVK